MVLIIRIHGIIGNCGQPRPVGVPSLLRNQMITPIYWGVFIRIDHAISLHGTLYINCNSGCGLADDDRQNRMIYERACSLLVVA